ncbi:MAG: AraC family transcriptional regulator [Mucilaginibacter sp.]
MKTFSLSRHSRLFAVPDSNKEYLFVRSGERPYYEEPYRAESYAIVYIKEGAVKMNAGLTSYNINAPAIITLGASVIRYFTKNSDLLKMDVIFFKDSFLLEGYADHFFLGRQEFFENNDLHVLPLKEADVNKFNKLYDLIQLTQITTTYHQAAIVRSYIFTLIYEVDDLHRQHSSEIVSPKKNQLLFANFRKLLSANYKQERKLDFYADHLHLTPKSLSAAIKKQSGKSAGKWIDETIILEAKVLLQNKKLTVSQIADMLNFSDQSVFGKFFRAGTGISPMAYRKKFD